jgi:hypothetical protein
MNEFDEAKGDSKAVKAAKAFFRAKMAEGYTKEQVIELGAKMIAERLEQAKGSP